MKKTSPSTPEAAGTHPSVDEVIGRMAHALGEGWMDVLEVQPETVRTWRKRQEVPVRKLLRAAQASGLPVEHFNSPKAEESRGSVSTKKSMPIDDEEFLLIDMLDARASAGGGAHNGESEVIGKFAFKRSWLRSKGLTQTNAKIIRAHGRSMADRINDGDILLVNVSVKTVAQDGVYVIERDGEEYVKLIQRDFSTGGVHVISHNKDYPPQFINADQLNDLRVCGRVVWHGGEL